MFTLLRPEDNIKLVRTDTHDMHARCKGFLKVSEALTASCLAAGCPAGEHSRPGDPLHGGGLHQRSAGHGGECGVGNGLQPLRQVRVRLGISF